MNAIVEFVFLLVLLSYLKPEEPWGLIAIGIYIIWKALAWIFFMLIKRTFEKSAEIIAKTASKF